MEATVDHERTVEGIWHTMVAAFSAADEAVPPKQLVAKKPWIRTGTLTLLGQRQHALIQGNYELEKALHKAARKSAKDDRAAWLDTAVEDGTWGGIRKLKHKRRANQGRLRDEDGELVSSEARADTMAAFLEKVQWRVRVASAVDQPPLRLAPRSQSV